MQGEFELIESIRSMFPSPTGVHGIGDDCAVIPQNGEYETLVSTDMLAEGIHFILDEITPYQLGWKSAAVNFSDIAAMGGEPAGSFLAVSLPINLPENWIAGFLKGYKTISDLYGFPLLGGDTTSSSSGVNICVTVLGRVKKGRSLKRSGAEPGDLICVSGSVGDSAAGLKALLEKMPRSVDVEYLVEKHYLPRPRMKEGTALAASEGVHSMMDVSDGIGSDIRHILKESDAGAIIDVNRLPLSRQLRTFCDSCGLSPYDFALNGGEDYELLFTVSPQSEPALSVPHTVIGEITSEPGLVWEGSDKDYIGFRHF